MAHIEYDMRESRHRERIYVRMPVNQLPMLETRGVLACLAKQLTHPTGRTDCRTNLSLLEIVDVLFKFVVLREELRDTSTLLTLQRFILQDTGHVRHTQGCPC